MTEPAAPTGPAPSSRAEAQLADLNRMRFIATGLLVLMLALYIATSALRTVWPGFAYPRAFAEAGIVGACADWFAVVALFRHPFGLPIPHTAIIPKQKQRIGDALGRFISNNFLAPAEVTARIERLDAAGWLAAWLKDPDNIKLVSSRSKGLLPHLLDLAGEGQIRDFSRSMIIRGIDSIAVAPLAGRTLSVLVARGYYDPAFDAAADMARRFLEAHKDAILQRVAKAGSSWVPGWLDVRLADAILSQVLTNLSEARASADHPWRVQGRHAIGGLIARLAGDATLFARCEDVKARVLDQKVVEGYLEWLGGEVETRLRDELGDQSPIVSSGLERALAAAGHWLENDAHMREVLNDWAQKLVLNTVVASRDEIGAFVSGVVDRWDTTTLVNRLELQVGRDLQYIRLNGTLVGGFVGLLLFAVSKIVG